MMYFDFIVYVAGVIIIVVGFWYSREQYLQNQRRLTGVVRRSFQSAASAEAEAAAVKAKREPKTPKS